MEWRKGGRRWGGRQRPLQQFLMQEDSYILDEVVVSLVPDYAAFRNMQLCVPLKLLPEISFCAVLHEGT